jgi:outer membrane lipoprotein-sorting protein
LRQNDSTLFMVFLYLVAAATMAAAQQISTPDLGTLLDNMESAQSANHAQYRPYTVVRDYKFFGNDPGKVSSRITAQINFQPPTTKNFTIEQAVGNGTEEKIVRRVLENETALTRDESATELSRRNYDFEFAGTEKMNGQDCYVLRISPKRNEKDMVRGQIWVDASTYLIRRIAGQLVKNPSWWVKDVQLTLDYSNVSGMWLHTATQAVADVRFLGRHTMESHDVNFSTTEVVAANMRPLLARDARIHSARIRRSRPGVALATGMEFRP